MFNNFLNFFSKATETNSVTIDLHSHLLPEIDDGVNTVEESLFLIKKFKALGYTKLITTPHIQVDKYNNTRDTIQEKLDEVRTALHHAKIDIELEAAAEHYVDTHFINLIQQNKILPFANKYILFETAYTTKPIMLETAIFEIQSKGYIPVLAHPERYRYMYNKSDLYFKLKELGVLFQLNIKSLRDPSHILYKMSEQLIQDGLVDFIGSDVHRYSDLTDLESIRHNKIYQTIFQKNTIKNDTLN